MCCMAAPKYVLYRLVAPLVLIAQRGKASKVTAASTGHDHQRAHLSVGAVYIRTNPIYYILLQI